MVEKQSKRDLVVALAIALLLTSWVQLPPLLEPYAVVEDFRNLYWVHRYQDPTLFPYAQIDHLDKAAPGYALLLRVGTIFFQPILVSKLLAFPLMVIAVYYIFRIVEQIGDGKAPLVAAVGFAVFNLASGSGISVAAGLQRSFALPLLAAFVYYLMIRRYEVAAVVIFLSGTVYIPIVAAMAIAYTVSCVRLGKKSSWQSAVRWRPLAHLLLALFAVVLVLLPTFARQIDKALSASSGRINPVHVLRDPTYEPGGRRALFYTHFPLIGRAGIVSDIRPALQLGILGLLAFIVRFVRRKPARRLAPALIVLFLGGSISFLLAWLAILVTSSFPLYLPSRHTQGVLFLLLVVFVFSNVLETMRVGALWLRRYRHRLVALVVPVLLVALPTFLFLPRLQADRYEKQGWLPFARWLLLGLVVVLVILTSYVVWKRRNEALNSCDEEPKHVGPLAKVLLASGFLVLSLVYVHVMSQPVYSPDEHERRLFSYVETLPNDALLAGDPCTLDGVPLYARRSVLFNCERYGDVSPDTIRDALSAYYAADWEEIYDFCREYGVTHLVVNPESYADEVVYSGQYFFEPYTSQVGDTISGREHFVLAEVAKEERLFQSGEHYVVSCQNNG